MRRAALALGAALLFAITSDPAIAQREVGANPRQGGAAPRGGAVARGGDGSAQAQGRGGQGRGRGRGAVVQGSSIIRGVVTAADTNTPLRRAQVVASSAQNGPPRAASSDANGRFELAGLPAGQWTVTASKGGFVSQQYGQRRSLESVAPIDLGDGQRFTANFALSRGGVITGRISDEYGDPVTGARVEVLRLQTAQGRRRLVPAGTANQTDDTGAFRVYGLDPGEYYVGARFQVAFQPGDRPPANFAPVYYPGTGNLADALRIKVEASAEQSGINFAVIPVRVVTISGTVTDTAGSPAQAVIALQSTSAIDGPLNVRAQSRSSPDGSFSINDVAPGEYTLEVNTVQGRGGATAPEVASIPLVVGSDDVTGLAIVTSKGGAIRGSVATDGGTRPTTTNLQVSAQPIGGGLRGTGLVAQVGSSGTFELAGLAGSYALRVDRVPDGWAVKSITLNGREMADVAFDVRGTDQIAARIVLTDRINELTGTVRAGGQASANASVVVFPEDPAFWPFPSRRVRTTRVDKDGVFRLRALPPGQRYLAIAVDYLEQGEFQDPEFLQRMKPRGVAITLGDGETKNIELPLIER